MVCGLRRRMSWCSLLFCWVFPLLCLSHTCPPDQYPYSCSSCLTFSLLNTSFSDARTLCAMENGQLLTITDQVQLDTLQLYLEGLGYGEHWVGYYFSGAGVVLGEDGGRAPSIVVDSLQQSSVGAGGREGDCVAVRGSKLVPVDCMRDMAHVCLFTYRAPYASSTSPQSGLLYPAPTNTVLLKANIAGLGVTGMEWRQNKMELRPSDSMETWTNAQLSQAGLTIHSFDPVQHEGFYELLVANPAGVAVVATWTIRQAELGPFTASPQDLNIPNGSIAFFECAASNATPTPTFSWYHKTELLADDGVKIYISNVTHTLLIRDVTAADEGGYQCVVESIAGRMHSKMGVLTVSPQEQFTDAPQQFLLQPHNQSVLEGNPYTVECVGLHTSRMVFYIMGVSILHPYNYPADPGFPALTIPRVSTEMDSLTSACLYGVLGDHFPSTPEAVLTVHTRPHVDSLVTSVGNNTDPHTIPLDSTLETECIYRGVPTPFQTWYVNGQELVAEDALLAISSSGSILVVQEVTDPPSGVYQCYISSQHGTDISSTVLCAEALPGPTPFLVQPDTTSSVYITWDSPHPPNTHPLLLQYEVITTHTPSSLIITSGTLPTHLHSYIVTGLNESIGYDVTVVASSPRGLGEQGVPQRVFPFGKAPTDEPSEFLNITVSRTHENSELVVQWTLTLPPSPGTIFTHYQVEYREMGGGEVGMVEVEANQNWAFVEGLKDASNYEVRLRVQVQVQREPLAYDHSPWSSWLEVQGVTTPPPTPPTNGTGTPSQGPAGNKPLDRDSLLLIVVLVPLLTVIAVVILLVVVMVGGWRYWSNST